MKIIKIGADHPLAEQAEAHQARCGEEVVRLLRLGGGGFLTFRVEVDECNGDTVLVSVSALRVRSDLASEVLSCGMDVHEILNRACEPLPLHRRLAREIKLSLTALYLRIRGKGPAS